MPLAVELLGELLARRDLPRERCRALFDEIMEGRVEPPLLGALLAALAAKGETVAELVGAAEAMRSRVTPIRPPADTTPIDTCGTGGDGRPTFNISTAVSIVAAAAGAVVAKHGNNSHTRPSGAAEGMRALGVDIEADAPMLERCLRECRVAFLYAPHLHPAMKHAAPVRRALGIRTIFNLLGPLTNPAGVRRQLLGVSRLEHVPLMTAALRELGHERAMVVHGLEGLCDLSVGRSSLVGRWDGHNLTIDEVDGSAVGAPPAPLEALFVRSPAESAAMIEAVLAGAPGPPRDVVVFNTAAALWVTGLSDDWADGAAQARSAIDSGAARATLAAWRAICPIL